MSTEAERNRAMSRAVDTSSSRVERGRESREYATGGEESVNTTVIYYLFSEWSGYILLLSLGM